MYMHVCVCVCACVCMRVHVCECVHVCVITGHTSDKASKYKALPIACSNVEADSTWEGYCYMT